MERTPRRGHWRYLTLALGLLAAHFLLAESSYAQKGRGFLQVAEGLWKWSTIPFFPRS